MSSASVDQGWLRALLCTLAATSCLLAIAASASQAASTPPALADAEAVPGELVVGFEEDSSSLAQRRAVHGAGGTIEDRVESIDSAIVTAHGRRTTEQLASELSRHDVVEFVEPNYILRGMRVPNDAEFGSLWGLRNTGQLGGHAGADINAVPAWDHATGGEIVVAVVDTGIDYGHPDLNDNMWFNPGEVVNGVDDDRDGFVDNVYGANFRDGTSNPYDDSSHGTHVAGIIGAEGNNGIGTVGVNWKVRLMALKFLDANGAGNTADAADAIDFAVDKGARVINASWGGRNYSYALFRAVRNAATRGVLLVAAAGNEGKSSDSFPEYPAAFDLPNVISVAASDYYDDLVDFSNFGARSVHLAAPGDEIRSTVPTHTSASGYASFSGTSMAAPFVAGAAALYIARTPLANSAQVRQALLASVDLIPSMAGKTATGGRLNVAKAFGVGRTAEAPAAQPSRDLTAPSPFRLIRPRNRYKSTRRGVRFRWQRSHDAGGIRYYRLYVDGKKRKTLRDPDRRPGGRNPATRTRFRLRGGRHRWYVRAFDYAGNSRKSKRSKRASRSTRVLFVGPRKR